MTSTLLTYKAWEADQGATVDVNSSNCDGLPSHFVSAYQKALGMLNARADFEEKISNKDVDNAERLQEFMVCAYFLMLTIPPQKQKLTQLNTTKLYTCLCGSTTRIFLFNFTLFRL